MNKKYVILVLFVLFILMLIPIPFHLKDGGSVEYRAILYKYTKYNGIDKYNYDIKEKLEILGFKVYQEKRENFVYEANFLIYAPENNGVSEDNIQKQEDYSNKLLELFTSSKNKQLVQEYFESLYNIKNANINIKIKSMDENNTKYHFELQCDKLDEDDCFYAQKQVFTYPLNQAEILYKLYIHRIDYSIKNKLTNQDSKITLNDIMDILNNYFSNDDIDKSNMAFWYTDEERNAVVIGMMNISEEKQNELLNNCFDEETISIIKENKMIVFEESIDTFDAKIIEATNDSITVEVLKESKAFKKSDKVTIKIERPTKTNDFYVVGNNIRITFNGMVETSNPAQIGASKIELID